MPQETCTNTPQLKLHHRRMPLSHTNICPAQNKCRHVIQASTTSHIRANHFQANVTPPTYRNNNNSQHDKITEFVAQETVMSALHRNQAMFRHFCVSDSLAFAHYRKAAHLPSLTISVFGFSPAFRSGTSKLQRLQSHNAALHCGRNALKFHDIIRSTML